MMFEFIVWFVVLITLIKWFEGWVRAAFVALYLLGSVVVFLV